MESDAYGLLAAVAAADSEESADLLVIIIPVVGALIGLGKAVIDFLQSRIRPASPTTEQTGAVRITQLHAVEAEYLNSRTLRQMKLAYFAVTLVSGASLLFFTWYFYHYRFQPALIGITVGFAATLLCAQRSSQLKNVKEPGALHSYTADIVACGDFLEVVNRSKKAMLALGAFRTAGAYVQFLEPRSAILQGGTGPWPSLSGERVTIKVQEQKAGECSISAESASFYPGTRKELKHVRNIAILMEQLLQ
jgi:hypothetical protein